MIIEFIFSLYLLILNKISDIIFQITAHLLISTKGENVQMKKTLSILIAGAILAGSLVSCSDSEVNEDETKVSAAPTEPVAEVPEETEEETSRFLDALEESYDFQGYKMRFIVEEGNNGNITALSIMADEDTGEVVDSAVYERNLAVNERLNIEITLVDAILFSGLPAAVKPSITAGSDDYDVIGTYQYYGIEMGPQGFMLNLSKLNNMDFSREYWGTDYINNMSYKGITYWATGDLALRYTGGMYATYINQTMWNSYYPDDDVYSIALEGGWTLDAMYKYSNGVYVDANGDGKVDKSDTFGFFFNIQDPVEGLAAGSMVRFSEVGEDGVPYISINNERSLKFYEKAYNLTSNNAGFFKENDDSVTVMNTFAEGRSLIAMNKIYQSGIYLREMDDEFRIIPVPKLDEAQEHYNTMLHDGVTLFGLPITNQKVEETTIALECMSSESHKTVTPAYYDVALKVKYARDSESGMMIDLIRENVCADFAALYSNSIGSIAHFFRNNLDSGKESIASAMEKQYKAWNKSLERLLQNIEKNGSK